MSITLDRIGKLVEETGATNRELAETIGCSKSAVQRYLTGQRDMPLSVVVGFARAFNVHPAYLFGWVDDRNYTIEKQPAAPVEDDELEENKKALMQLVRNCSEESAGRLLQIMQLFLESEKQGN